MKTVLDKAEAIPSPRVSALSSAADTEPHAGDASARPYRGTLTVVPSLLYQAEAGPSGSAALDDVPCKPWRPRVMAWPVPAGQGLARLGAAGLVEASLGSPFARPQTSAAISRRTTERREP
jgi:hypothetical protein